MSDPLLEARPLYLLPGDDLAKEVLIPAFGHALSARCMIGFFSSAALRDLAPGLSTYIRSAEPSFRLVISPFITDADRQALETGVRAAPDVAAGALNEALMSSSALESHTLKCLSYLLSVGRIDVRIALMRDALFHPKVWLFDMPAGRLAVHGSSNLTHSGLRRNKEQVAVSKAWVDSTQRYVVDKLERAFEALWDNLDDDCIVVGLPEAIRAKILKEYPVTEPPTESEYLALYQRLEAPANVRTVREPALPEKTELSVPKWFTPYEGLYSHQGAAADAWVAAGFRGTLEMATGSGKTLTSLFAAYLLHQIEHALLIVIAAPYLPLINQWCGEVLSFGVRPIDLTKAGGREGRSRVMQQVRRRLRLGLSRCEVVVVSHDTLCDQDFQADIKAVECHRLLIADEAHNLGGGRFGAEPPAFIESRLALSATPVRQYDPDGTDKLFAFFGPVVYRFGLKEAIGRCLVEYDYYLHPVRLTSDEMDRWREITVLIRKNAWRGAAGDADEYLAKLLRDRRALLETACGKIDLLRRLLSQEERRAIRHTLIYATDKDPEQLRKINDLLSSMGILFHQLTAEETRNAGLTGQIIADFQAGDIQVLTAKRVLDEGVNIPQIVSAFILASTTVERQWIQRRGRVLRLCKETGKTFSVIHDFVAIPPDIEAGLDDDARDLVKGELRRCHEFASLARNAGRPDGPLDVIHELVKATFL